MLINALPPIFPLFYSFYLAAAKVLFPPFFLLYCIWVFLSGWQQQAALLSSSVCCLTAPSPVNIWSGQLMLVLLCFRRAEQPEPYQLTRNDLPMSWLQPQLPAEPHFTSSPPHNKAVPHVWTQHSHSAQVWPCPAPPPTVSRQNPAQL